MKCAVKARAAPTSGAWWRLVTPGGAWWRLVTPEAAALRSPAIPRYPANACRLRISLYYIRLQPLLHMVHSLYYIPRECVPPAYQRMDYGRCALEPQRSQAHDAPALAACADAAGADARRSGADRARVCARHAHRARHRGVGQGAAAGSKSPLGGSGQLGSCASSGRVRQAAPGFSAPLPVGGPVSGIPMGTYGVPTGRCSSTASGARASRRSRRRSHRDFTGR
jgi:hypothetical protein